MQATVTDLVLYVLQALEFSLRGQLIKAAAVNTEWIEKHVQIIFARRHTHQIATDLVTDLGKTKTGKNLAESELQKILEVTADYRVFAETFDRDQSDADPVQAFKSEHKSGIFHLIIDFLYDTMGGVYDTRLEAALAAAQSKTGSAHPRDMDLLTAESV